MKKKTTRHSLLPIIFLGFIIGLSLSGCFYRSSGGLPYSTRATVGSYVFWEGRTYRVYRNSAVQRYLDRVGQKVARVAPYRSHCCRYVVYVHHKANAFSRTDGTIFLSTGLLRKIDNEAQLAAIIGHELAHIILNHSRQMVHGGYSYGFGYPEPHRHPHSLEFEADAVGLKYAARAGYDPNQLIRIYRRVHFRRLNHPRRYVSSRYPDARERLQRIRRTIRQLGYRYHAHKINRRHYQETVRSRLH